MVILDPTCLLYGSCVSLPSFYTLRPNVVAVVIVCKIPLLARRTWPKALSRQAKRGARRWGILYTTVVSVPEREQRLHGCFSQNPREGVPLLWANNIINQII